MRVLKRSPAEQAGIRTGDQIIALNGEEIVQLKDMIALLAWVPLDKQSTELAAKEGIQLTLRREQKEVEVTLAGAVFRNLELPQ